MSSLNDSQRITSIEQLLNPMGSTHPIHPGPSPSHDQLHRHHHLQQQQQQQQQQPLQHRQEHQHHQDRQHQQHQHQHHHREQEQNVHRPPNATVYQSYATQASFNLRAANWSEQVPEDPTAVRTAVVGNADTTGMPARAYPQIHATYPDRLEKTLTNSYHLDGGVWAQPRDPAVAPYGVSTVAPVYSDERTDHYNQTYQDSSSSSNAPSTSWIENTSDRNQTRLPTRGPPSGPLPLQMPIQLSSQPGTPPALSPGTNGYAHDQPRYAVPAVYYAPPGIALYTAGIHPQALLPPPPQPQALPQKRPAPIPEDVPAPKAKKAKSKAKSTEGANITISSKRGYNAKKRSEAAQIAAQNAQLMPTVSYTSGDKGKEKDSDTRMRLISDETSDSADTSGPLHPELQFARCMSNRYRSENFPRCVSCTRRWAGDTCRFQGIRFFLKNAQRDIVGLSFVESQKADGPTMSFPSKWNVPLKSVHITRTTRIIAEALLPTLKQELKHLDLPEIIRRPRESEVRSTCDTCMTSLFSSSWMCRQCGREACAECFEKVKELTQDRPGATEAEIAALQARREKHAHSNPFFLSCTRRNEHTSKEFSPMSRFCKVELSQAIEDMNKLLEAGDEEGNLEVWKSGATVPNGSGIPSPSEVETNGTNGEDSGESIPYHPTRRFEDAELTEEEFSALWDKGEPIVVTGLLGKFKLPWTPEYFVEKHGSQACLIIDSQTDQNKRVTVGEFFSWFGKYEGRKEHWKLKDWPPSVDFKDAFPELYEEFNRVVPVPNYSRRDGVMNIASHFPSNAVTPDLGPKMCSALAASEGEGTKGSTKLHMGIADTLNIMTYAAQSADGKPGCAAWDVFKAEDSDKIRQFLRKMFKGSVQHDPIHSQQFYLDDGMRRELFASYGIKSHRVYQKPGEAIFIPAGCAHQVCNLADCIKIGVDFVSPESIEKCEKLTKEFREQNQSMVWKEDVLQLRTMMWFAWLSCSRQES